MNEKNSMIKVRGRELEKFITIDSIHSLYYFEFDDIRVEFDNRRVYKGGAEISLKPREFDLLEVLVNNRNLALSREKLLQLVWEFDYEGDTRTVDVHVQRLRQKLGIADRLQTVYKTGYRFEI